MDGTKEAGEIERRGGAFFYLGVREDGTRGGGGPWVRCGERTQDVLRGIVTQAGMGALEYFRCGRSTEGELQELGESYRRYGLNTMGGQVRLL